MAGEVLLRGDGIVHSDRSVVQKEWRAFLLLCNPLRCLGGEQRHDTVIHPPRCIDIEDGRFGTFSVFGAIGDFEVEIIGIRTVQLRASRDLAAAQAIDEAVLDIHAGEISMIAGNSEMVVKSDVQRAGRKLCGVVRAPFQRAVICAIAQMPFANRRRFIAVLLEQRGHVQPRCLDVQRRKSAQHLMRQRGAPAVAARHHRITCW